MYPRRTPMKRIIVLLILLLASLPARAQDQNKTVEMARKMLA